MKSRNYSYGLVKIQKKGEMIGVFFWDSFRRHNWDFSPVVPVFERLETGFFERVWATVCTLQCVNDESSKIYKPSPYPDDVFLSV